MPQERDGKLRVGSLVRHVVKNKEHDNWTGMVLGECGNGDRNNNYGHGARVLVRWIRPCGDPTGGVDAHLRCELKPIRE